MTISNATKAQLEQLAHQLQNLKVEEREALDQMLPERKVFRASEEQRAHQDLVYANAAGSLKDQARRAQEVDSRRIEGLAKNAATQNRNEQKHFQILRDMLDALGLDNELIHSTLTKFIAAYEMDRKADRKEMDRFKADVMEELLLLRKQGPTDNNKHANQTLDVAPNPWD